MFWAVMTVIANALSIGLIVAFFVPAVRDSSFGRFFQNQGMVVAFIVALCATIGSLGYSDVIGYEPCKLCWFQRICMYPQVVILGLGLLRKDLSARTSALWLSVVGALIGAYHYVGQIGFNPLGLDCLAVGYSASCSKSFVLELGYVSIPMMALSAFVLIILSLVWYSRSSISAQ